MVAPTVDRGGAGSFKNVRDFLRYVEGARESADGIPPSIARDLEELENRAMRIRALTGVLAPVELSPYVVDLLDARGGCEPAAGEGVLNAAGA